MFVAAGTNQLSTGFCMHEWKHPLKKDTEINLLATP